VMFLFAAHRDAVVSVGCPVHTADGIAPDKKNNAKKTAPAFVAEVPQNQNNLRNKNYVERIRHATLGNAPIGLITRHHAWSPRIGNNSAAQVARTPRNYRRDLGIITGVFANSNPPSARRDENSSTPSAMGAFSNVC